MNKKRLIITSIFSIILVVILMLGSTYSLFTLTEEKENLETNVYTTGNLNITYTVSEDTVKLDKSIPVTEQESLSIKPYRVTVTNTGNVPYMFDLKLNSTTASDEIDNQYIMTQVGKIEPKTLESCVDNILKEDIIVPAGESVDVDVRVYISKDIKNSEIGKSFFAKLEVSGLAIYDEFEEIDSEILVATYYGEVTITFDANGGDVSESSKKVLTTLTYGELPTPTRTDVVTYETNGGSDVNFVNSLIANSKNSFLNELNKPKVGFLTDTPNVITIDYEFDGWYLDKQFTKLVTSESIVDISNDSTLYAKWIGDNVITLPSTNRTNYHFDGWYSDTNYQNKIGDPGDSYTVDGSIAFYGKWTRTHFTLNYNNNGGTGCVSSQISLTATTYGELCTPTRLGYEFLGWYTAASGGTLVTSTTTIPESENHTIYAQWEAKIYTVKFHNNLNYLSGADSVIVTLSGRNYYKKYDDPALVGYLYNESYTGPVLVGTTANSVAYYTDHDSATTFTSEGNFEQDGVTYYYSYTAGYRMAGDLTDTSGLANRVKYSNMTVAEAARQILADQDVTLEQEMNYGVAENLTANTYSKTGYTFNGWSTSPTGNKAYDDSQSLNSETVYDNNILNLYANWTVNGYTLVANPNGGTNGSTTGWGTISNHSTFTKNISYGSTFGTLPTPTRTGYTFNGWTNVATIGTFSLTGGTNNYIYKNVLYDIYPGTTYTVTMDSATLTTGTATKFATLLYDFTTNTPLVSTQTDFVSGISYTITCPTTATASNDIRLIIYSGVNGSTSGNNTTFTNVKISTNNTTAATTQTASTPFSVAANQTIFASWTINSYTLTVKPNGGTWNSKTTDSTFTQNYGTTKSIAVPSATPYYTITYNGNGGTTPSSTKAYRAFAGWTKSGSGSITATTPVATSAQTYTFGAGNGTLTASYNSTANSTTTATSSRSYTITYNTNSTGATSSASTGTVAYTMNGWYTATSGGTKRATNGGAYAPTASETVYAQWSAGSTTLATITKSGSTCTWNTKSDGTGTSYASGKTGYTTGAAVTLYARCIVNNYQISSGSATYANTFANAVAWSNAGATITLLNSISDSSSGSISKNITFNTNGKTLTRTSGLTVASGVTATISGSGKITSSGNVIVNNGTLTINGPTLAGTGTSAAVHINSTGTTTMSSGIVTATGATAFYINTNTGAVTISGGTISSSSAHGIHHEGSGKLTINANISAKNNAVRCNNPSLASVVINGGNYLGVDGYGIAMVTGTTASLTVNDGYILSNAEHGIALGGSGAVKVLKGRVASKSKNGIYRNDNGTGIVTIGSKDTTYAAATVRSYGASGYSAVSYAARGNVYLNDGALYSASNTAVTNNTDEKTSRSGYKVTTNSGKNYNFAGISITHYITGTTYSIASASNSAYRMYLKAS